MTKDRDRGKVYDRREQSAPANARKGMLAALGSWQLPFKLERGFQIAEKLVSMSIYQAV
jgi:hypothetical protein